MYINKEFSIKNFNIVSYFIILKFVDSEINMEVFGIDIMCIFFLFFSIFFVFIFKYCYYSRIFIFW